MNTKTLSPKGFKTKNPQLIFMKTKVLGVGRIITEARQKKLIFHKGILHKLGQGENLDQQNNHYFVNYIKPTT